MPNLIIKILLLQGASKGKPNHCSSCQQPVKYNTEQRYWYHIKDANCANARKPTKINKKPVFIRYFFSGQVKSKIDLSTTIKVNPMDFNNNAEDVTSIQIEGDPIKTAHLKQIYNDVLTAGLATAELGNKTNKMWRDRLKKPNRIISPIAKNILSIKYALEYTINNYKFIGVGSKDYYLSVSKAFFEFLESMGIVPNAEPLDTITMDHLMEFEEWQFNATQSDGTKRFKTTGSIETRVGHLQTYIKRAEKHTPIHPSVKEPYRSELELNIYTSVDEINLLDTNRPLTRDQFDKIIICIPGAKLKAKNGHDERIKFLLTITHKMMLFQLLTGFAAVDLANFKESDINSSGDKILKYRQKKRQGSRGNIPPTPATIIVYNKTREIIDWFNENRSHKYYPHQYKCRGGNCDHSKHGFFPLPTLPLDQKNIKVSQIKAAAKALDRKYKRFVKEIPNFGVISTHMLRRTSATILACAQVPLDKIADHLGDSSGKIVKEHYVGNADYKFDNVYQNWFLEKSKTDEIDDLIANLPPELQRQYRAK